ncbi:MAG: type II toxin-antitoxin system RelE/ParE family toxin [bacterium]|nr:type II toxin-antitoxin system RelE/ParE family toxin [bacterium]
MIKSLTVRPEAEEDIREAYEWYESKRCDLGHEFVEEIELLFQQIEERPNMFPKVYGNLRRGFPHRFPYAVYFLVEGATIVIKGVFHQRRNPAEWLKRYYT